MRWVLIIAAALLLALPAPAMAETVSASQATGAPTPDGFQWSRFSSFGQGDDGYVSINDPQRLGDLKWSPEKAANPYSMRLPFEPPIGSLTARFQTNDRAASAGPMFEGATSNERSPEANGGYMALEWRAGGSWALTLGGGYSESSAFTGSGSGASASGRSFASTRSSAGSSSGGASRYDALRRYGAYLAAPYQLTDRIGLRPEVSYFYEDSLSGAAEPGNEWVMGLQCSFGF